MEVILLRTQLLFPGSLKLPLHQLLTLMVTMVTTELLLDMAMIQTGVPLMGPAPTMISPERGAFLFGAHTSR
jgi:membrane-bound metal-dependent hydrolase YbcI (DUF457 family)